MNQTNHKTILNQVTLIESLECAIIVINREYLLELVNISTETLFCQSRRNMLGKPLRDFIDNPLLDKCIAECFDKESQFTVREVSLVIMGRESLVDVTLSSTIIPNTDSMPIGSGASDGDANETVPQRSILIELNVINRISRFMKEKHQLERQQAFRLMMRGLAHEIKNPLGGIRGAAQLLDREIDEPSQKELTDILIKEADRLTRLVDRVMGSREQLKPQYVNIHEVLEHVVHLVSVRGEQPISVERFYDPALPEIKVDKEQLIQAVLNIVGNGIEAQVGQAKVKLGFITHFERFVTLNQVVHRQALRIKIWDNGPGVPIDLRDNLFDPLVTGRPEGTGLGLSITQEIVQRHKGVVKLDEHHGKTCFSIYLPYINGDKSTSVAS